MTKAQTEAAAREEEHWGIGSKKLHPNAFLGDQRWRWTWALEFRVSLSKSSIKNSDALARKTFFQFLDRGVQLFASLFDRKLYDQIRTV